MANSYLGSNGVYNQSLSGGDPMTNFMVSSMNNQANTGANQTSQGGSTYNAGLEAFGPVLAHLTSLVNGNQGDISQAIQPEANRIKDSFAAVRNMISQQPRGGGKTSALAESGFQEAQQIGDVAAGARQNATGQLGSIAGTLAGLGLSQEQLGAAATANAAGENLQRRNLNMTAGSFANQFGQIASGIGSMVNAAGNAKSIIYG